MKYLKLLLLTGFLLLGACESETGIDVHGPWIRATAAGDNGAVYFVIHNHSEQADELVGVWSDVAAAVEIHQSSVDPSTDVMKMEMVSSIPMPADAEIIFAPGKYHLMLIHMNRELKLGDEISVTLHFRDHEDIIMNVAVQDAAPDEDHPH